MQQISHRLLTSVYMDRYMDGWMDGWVDGLLCSLTDDLYEAETTPIAISRMAQNFDAGN